ncbi:hypothetical protein KKD61_05445 [Patescibacteria group bacterium]|nr:hypothetical protein [Patescibacteria group bacterium]
MTDENRLPPVTDFVYPVLSGEETVWLRSDRVVRVWVHRLESSGKLRKLNSLTGRITCCGGSEILDFKGAKQISFQACPRTRRMLKPAKSGSKTRFVSREQILAEPGNKSKRS